MWKAILLFFVALTAQAAWGPFDAEYIKSFNGESPTLRISTFPGQFTEEVNHIAGIQVPDLHGKCVKERTLAVTARNDLKEMLEGKPLKVMVLGRDNRGRLELVVHVDGHDVAEALVKLGDAAPYSGEGPRHDWCH